MILNLNKEYDSGSAEYANPNICILTILRNELFEGCDDYVTHHFRFFNTFRVYNL